MAALAYDAVESQLSESTEAYVPPSLISATTIRSVLSEPATTDVCHRPFAEE